jgi:uracil-DNA glycosylase family 4
MSREIADHLRYYADLGVTGLSRDPAWRARAAAIPSPGAIEESGTLGTPGTLESLDAIKTDIGPACMRCKLCSQGRSQIVFGVGHPKARLMLVGEAPGEEEDKRGEPFVGRAGQLLTKIIESIGLSREQVYIANVIKCRPPDNRNPEPDEVAACEPYLFRQIDVIQPMVIVPLGKFAAQCLLKTTDPITRLRGRRFDYRGTTLIPTFHPAYLLRNPSAKREVWDDMKLVRAILQGDA